MCWAAGKAEAIEVLGRYKSNVDSGAFQAIQYAGIEALEGPQDCVEAMQALYQERRDLALAWLTRLGWKVKPPRATFYLWVPVPKGHTSTSFAELILEKAGVVITPGSGYGKHGEGYFRIALTVDKSRMEEAFKRIEKAIGKADF